jgi:6,7-dimethyl-8-ribityllumazine synthase
MKVYEGKLIGKGRKFGIVLSRFNQIIADRLLEGAVDCLIRHEVNSNDIEVFKVPGTFEIPQMAKVVANLNKFNAIICLGALIRGDTPHFEYLASQVTRGIQEIAIKEAIPISFGIITADTLDQAIDRAGAKSGNKGFDAAMAALETLDVIEKAKS